MYFLVLLTEVPDGPADVPEHEPFIDSLISRQAVLLGGAFEGELASGVSAGYLLRCADLAEAQQIVASDPLITSGAYLPMIARWELVGIDAEAIDPELLV